MKRHLTLFTILLTSAFTLTQVNVQAQIATQTGSNPAFTYAANVTGTGLAVVGTGIDSTGNCVGSAYSSRGYKINQADSLGVQFTIQPTAGYSITYQSLTFNVGRDAHPQAPTIFNIGYSLDGGNTFVDTLGSTTITSNTCPGSSFTWNFADFIENGTVTFRIWYFGENNQTRYATLTSVSVAGIVASCNTFAPALAVAETSGASNNDGIICAGASAELTASATGGTPPYTYSWDPNIGSGAGPHTVMPASTTTYTVTVSDNGGCTGSLSTTITVNPLPTPGITVAETSGTADDDGIICNGAEVTLTASGGGSYAWSNPPGGTDPAIMVTPSTTTIYTVTVTVDGCPASTSQTITVNALPTATISANPATACQGGPAPNITFTGANGAEPYTFTYTIDGGSNQTISTTSGSSVDLPVSTGTAGTFTYALVSVSDNNGCSQTQPGSASVTVHPNPSCSISGPDPVCNNTTGYVYSATTGMSNYSWSIEGNGTINGDTDQPTVTVDAGAAGTFTITVVITDANGCSATCSQTVTVVENMFICSITGPEDVCPDGTNTYTGPDGMSAYLWTISGDGTIIGADDEQTVSVLAGTSGSYTLTLATTVQTCTATCELPVTIAALPVLTLVIDAPASVTCGEMLTVAIEVGSGFVDLASLQYSINWDTSELMYFSHANVLSIGTGAPLVGVGVTNPMTPPGIGYLSYSWADPAGTDGEDLGDGTLLLEITFKVLKNDVATQITLTGDPLALEVSNYAFCSGTVSAQPASVDLEAITISLDPIAPVCPGTTSVDLVYTATSGSPDEYSIDFDANAEAEGFVDVDFTALPVSPISIPVSETAPCGTYNAVLTIRNSTTGCENSYDIVITLSDTEDPTLIDPGVGCSSLNQSALNLCLSEAEAFDATTLEGAVAALYEDNCGSVSATLTQKTPGNDNSDCSWLFRYTFEIIDACGNSVICDVLYSGGDSEAPMLADISVDCSSLNESGLNQCLSEAATFDAMTLEVAVAALYKDNCGSVLARLTGTAAGTDNSDCSWSFTYTFTIIDDCKNSVTCDVVYSGGDSEEPALVNPNLDCSSLNQSGLNLCLVDAAAFDAKMLEAAVAALYGDNCGVVSASLIETTPGADNSDCAWSFIYTFEITDECGNSVACSIEYSGGDSGDPVLAVGVDCSSLDRVDVVQCLADATAFDATILEAAVAALYTDNCGTVSASLIGTTAGANNSDCSWMFTYTFEIMDECGNSVTCEVEYSGGDTEAPMLVDPAADCSSLNETKIDRCLSDAATFDPATLEDAVAGLYEDNCSASVTVVAGIPIPGVLNTDCAWTFSYPFIISDDCGNTTTCLVVYSGGDDSPPTWLTAAGDLDVTVECGNTADLAIALSLFPVATDICDQDVTDIVKVSGTFEVGGDCPPLSGTITNTWTVTDDCGNTSTVFTQVITISDTKEPTWVTQPGDLDRTVECSDDAGLTAAQSLSPIAMDNCDPLLIPVKTAGTVVPGPDCPQEGTITNTWVVTDDCSNTSTVFTQVITIVDTQEPTWVTQDGALDVTVECDDAQGLADAQALFPEADDSCDDDVTDISKTEGTFVPGNDCPQEGTITNTWTVTDDCGNESTVYTQIITIVDTQAPTWLTPLGDLDRTVECDDQAALAAAQALFPVADDNCDDDVTNFMKVGGAFIPGPDCPQEGTITNFWRVADDCGNISTVYIQVITIEDTQAPILTGSLPGGPVGNACQADMPPPPLETDIAAEYTDNCGKVTATLINTETTGDDCSWAVTYTYTVEDDCGNLASNAIVTYTGGDTEPPMLTGTLPAGGPVGNVCQGAAPPAPLEADIAAQYTDNCGKVTATLINTETDGDECGWMVTYTYTVEDECSNFASNVVVIYTGGDTEPPTLTGNLPGGNIGNACQGDAPLAPLEADIAAQYTDNCSNVTATLISTVPNGDDCNWTVIYTYTVKDECGNFAANAEVTYAGGDDEPPVLTGTLPGQNLGNVCLNEAPPAPLEADIAAEYTDNCGDVTATLIDTETIGDDCDWSITYTYTIEDECGNFADKAVVTFSGSDNEAPTFTTPIDIPGNDGLQCGEENDLNNTGFPTNLTDNCLEDEATAELGYTSGATSWMTPKGYMISYTDVIIEPHPNGDCSVTSNGLYSRKYRVERTFTVKDACGNSTMDIQLINIVDNTPPVLSGCPQDATVECDAIPMPPVIGTDITATDNCDDPIEISIVFDQTTEPGNCDDAYSIIRSWTATDRCGYATTCVQTITVVDTTQPTWDDPMPADETVECDAVPTVETFTASDNCDTDVEVTFEEVRTDGDCPNRYSLTRTWTATDNCDNTIVHTQTIKVEDTTPPVITFCPPAVTVECGESLDPNVNDKLGLATATDNCAPPPMVTFADITVGSNCPQEATLFRTWTATDACGNTATCGQSITVDDSTPPVISCPADATIECDEDSSPANTGMATATDNCGGMPVVTFADASTQTNDGSCTDYTYTITRTWTATDACGNATSCAQTIEVEDTQFPTFDPACQFNPLELFTSEDADCPADAQISLSVGQTISNSDTWTVAGVEIDPLGGCVGDNCAEASDIIITVESIDVDDSALPCERKITISFELSDPCGNTNPELFTCVYIIRDDVAPKFTVPGPVTISCEQDENDLDITGDVTDEIDDCQDGLEAKYSDDDSGLDGCNGTGTIVRTWTLDDGCGNFIEQIQIITVVDNTAPVLTCPKDTVINCEVDPTTANTGIATATDNCDATVIPTHTDVVTPGNCPDRRTIIRTWTVADDCGNSTLCVQTIAVQDTTKPVIVCPMDVTVECDESPDPGPTTPAGIATATDNCDASPAISHLDTPVPGDCPQEYVINRRWVAVDNCLNASACVQKITVVDETPPVITCPPAATVECDEDSSPANTGTATANDNCDSAPKISFGDVSTQTTNGSCSDFNYTITRTWTAEDACGNATNCVQTITVNDTTEPEITCPATATVECDQSMNPGPNTPTGYPTATDNCDPAPGITFTDDDPTPDPDCPQAGSFIRTWVAVDACENVSICEQLIIVVDNTAPVVVCPKDTVINCDTDKLPATLGSATATDNCGTASTPTFSDETATGQCPLDEIITRTWVSMDECGNEGSCIQIIIVQDTVGPIMTCPKDTIINCDTDRHPDFTGYAIAGDNCDPLPSDPTFSDSNPAGECPQVITRTWLSEDACGNTGTCVQLIMVQDTTRPVIVGGCDLFSQYGNNANAASFIVSTSSGADCPAVATVNLSVGQEIMADYEITVGGIPVPGFVGCFEDNCSPVSDLKARVVSIAEDGDDCQKVFTVRLVVVDACENESLDTIVYKLEVIDNTAPIPPNPPAPEFYQCADDVPPPGPLTALDNCAGPVVAIGTDVDNGGTGCINDPLVITRTWIFNDGCDNTAEIFQVITVVDDEAPKLSCPPNLSIDCELPATPANTGMATATDNCDADPDISFTDVSTQTNNQTCTDQSYVITRTWMAVDECGNQAVSCVQIITVRDVKPPVITCPPAVSVDCGASLDPSVNTALGTATATDNCDPQPGVTFTDLTLSTAPICPEVKVIIRTWLAVDNCNNPVSCTQRIAVLDLAPPVISCPKDTVINCEADYSIAALGAATATDNCGTATVINPPVEITMTGNCPQAKIIKRTWTAIDNCANTAQCTQTIMVQDTTRPVIVCPPAATVQCGESIDPAVNPNVGEATATDNCDAELGTSYLDTDLGGDDCTKTVLRNWVTIDDCNNAAACTQLITITDSEPPKVSCPDDVTVECDGDTSPDALGYATAEDACGAATTPTFTDDSTLGDCPQEKTILRKWISEDGCGNVGSCVQTIFVEDSTPPAIDCPADITVDCGDELDPYQNGDLGIAEATDNCDDQPVITYADETEQGSCPTGTIILRSWTATDACGNATNCIQRIALIDNAPPTISCPDDVTVDCGDELDPYINTALGVAVATDDCAAQTVLTYADVSLGVPCPLVQIITRTWTVVDPCDNSTLCVQLITVQDVSAPVIDCPQDLTLEWPAGFNTQPVDPNVPQDPSVDPFNPVAGTPGTGVPEVKDNCGDTKLDFKDELKGPNPDDCPELWVLERTWMVTDGCGLTATCVQRIVFTDLTPPVIDCPQDLTLEWPAGFNTQPVDPNVPQDPSVDPFNPLPGTPGTGVPEVSDNCGTPKLGFKDELKGPNPDDCPELWVLERTWLATDACGNTNTCIQRIVFTDLTPPDISCPKDTVIDCTADTKPVSTGMATATDNCGIPVLDFSDDVDPLGCPHEAVIIRTWTAKDACGNIATCMQFITVQDTTPPTFTAPKDTVLYQDSLCQVTIGDLGDVTDEADNCSTDIEATFMDDVEPGPGQSERTIFRTWKLTDDCGNMTIHTQRIAIRDTIPPMLECPKDTVLAPNTDTCTHVVKDKWFDPKMLKDNCGVDTTFYMLSGATTGMGGNTLQGVVLNVGNTIVKWTVVDINGNTATCTSLIRVSICSSITGTIIWEGNDADTVGVAQVTVELSGDDTGAVGPTPANGTYIIAPGIGTNFMITPKKPGTLTTIPINPMNGVTADDALAIRLHVYGFIPITDPYKLIAADVDMDNMVTLNDEVLIRRALLGSELALEYFRIKPWRFVPDTTDTPWSLGYHPPANPFSAIIPDKRTLTGVTAGANKQNFYGIKVGDVNATANPLLHPVPVEPLIFRVQDEQLVAGKELMVYFRAENFSDLLYFQQALHADPAYLKLIGVETAASPLGLNVDDNFGLSMVDDGEIRTLWMTASGQSIKDGTPVFALRFKALQGDRLLSEVLRLKPKALEPVARNADLASAALLLVFDEAQTTSANEPLVLKQIELQQNNPNPFWYSTVIGFVLPEACNAQLRIIDASGRELLRIDNDYPAGYNAETIYLRDIGTTGILYYELTTPYGKRTRTMKAVRP